MDCSSQTHKDVSNCNELNMKKDANISFIKEWFEYYYINKEQSFMDNLICVWNQKKIVMIDNFYPEHSDDDRISKMFIRYIMTQCNVKMLISSGYDTTIYYDPSLWKDALLLYLYQEERLVIPNSLKSEYFLDLFQGILLGYKFESIYEYIFSKLYIIELTKENSTYTDQDKIEYYKMQYQFMYVENQLLLEEINNGYDKIIIFINVAKQHIESNPIMIAFASGLSEKDTIDLSNYE